MKTPFVVYLVLESPEGWSTVEPFECSALHPEIALRLAERRGNECRHGDRLIGIAEVAVNDTEEPHLAVMQHQSASRPCSDRAAFSAFNDPRWAGTKPSERDLADALAEPANLIDLPGLENVAWDTLTHAYGSAHDVPIDLERLASVDSDAREQAIDELSGSIYHQGDLFEATAYAIPFLVQLIKSPHFPDRQQVLEFLCEIAACADVPPATRRQTWEWRRKTFGEIYAKPTAQMAEDQVRNDAAVREEILRFRHVLYALQGDSDTSISDIVTTAFQETDFLRGARY